MLPHMDDAQAFFTQVVQESYRQAPLALVDLQHFRDPQQCLLYQMYRVTGEDGSSWILQAYHDQFVTRTIYPWASQRSVVLWVQQRAELLASLAREDYPAPRVIATHDGALTCRVNSWTVLVTSVVAGTADETSKAALYLTGAALGRLHQLPLPVSAPPSWWTPTTIAHARDQIFAVTALVPPSHQEMHQHFLAVVQTILASPNLPQSLIHGDCWPPNVLNTSDAVTFVDWEFAGLGTTLLDLGALLLMAQCNKSGDLPEEMDRERVIALVEGYATYRRLEAAELSLLLDAIRFSIAWRAALAFSRVKEEGWHEGIERLLGRAQRGYTVAEPIAHLARTLFSDVGSPQTR